MKCLAPIKVYNKYTGRCLWVSCNRCSHCLENTRDDWLFRLDYELKFSYLGVHCTLQFSDDYIGDNVLNKRDLQLFFKRLRHDIDFRYYAIGEYGTLDRRKHYHVAFFVKSIIHFVDFRDFVIKNWPYGYVFFTRLKHRRIAYVLHYHVRPKVVDEKPTFQLFSKGLGEYFCDDNELRDFCLRNNTVFVVNNKGNKQRLPRYYRKKFGYEFTQENFDSVQTTIQNIEKMAGLPLEEISTPLLNKYKSTLFLKDLEKRMKKYNCQNEI